MAPVVFCDDTTSGFAASALIASELHGQMGFAEHIQAPLKGMRLHG